ncbi:MAG: class I SAM-dependent methyltransferase [Ruminococcaceae bacterium]|nr:class I SAM-dependent methyltransferase [Oscillospiraceae bacterium]
MSSYTDFAYLYDRLTDDVDYTAWADYLEQLFAKFCTQKPQLVCDLACGTGSICAELSKRGYDMTGIDLSPDMLDVAAQKSVGLPVLYLNQDITTFELYGTMDAILCLLDSVNYITDPDGVAHMMKLVKNYLNPGGVFIFDINTPYKFQKILADNVFTYDDEDLFYCWECGNDGEIWTHDLNFFVRNQTGSYERITEYHEQKLYLPEQIEQMAKDAGLVLEGCYDQLTCSAPHSQSERVFYVFRG